MYEILLGFITAFVSCYFLIPPVIFVAQEKGLCDEPGERRSHTVSTPSLGGIAIFVGTLFSVILWMPFTVFKELQYTLCAFIIIFLIGVKDDIMPMSPYKKLLGQMMAAGIVVFKSGVQITSLYGFLGIEAIPVWVGIPLTLFTIIVITNAFNLIDGINGLSGSITVLITIVLGYWFFLVDRTSLSILSFAVAGAATGFLRYNYTPAKIFMGDTGALFIGLVISILIIKFIEINQEVMLTGSMYALKAGPAVAIGILILPLFDTARVFTMRIMRGRSPFSPDRLHLHHLLVDFGFTHMQATAILVMTTTSFIIFVFLFQNIGTFKLLFAVLAMAVMMSYMLRKKVEKRQTLNKSPRDMVEAS
jgi:UDP-GlcNAc:undecaprenyl-phosphate/decaprenyl-phosphate GlcNAc-1-phosphate transferase